VPADTDPLDQTLRALARVRTSEGQTVELFPGDFVGRWWTAALRLDDARISEAHAMVSLRGRDLKLLALRGRLAVERQPVSEVTLQPGLRVYLARDLWLEVEHVETPSLVLALAAPGLDAQILSGSVCSLCLSPAPLLRARYDDDAVLHLWSTGSGWRAQRPGQPVEEVGPGSAWEIDGARVELVTLSLDEAGLPATQMKGQLPAQLRLVTHYDTVHLHCEGQPPLTLSGISSRIVSELVALGGPASWETVAGLVWRDESDRFQLRRKWDVNLARLRGKLREGRVRPDLIHSDGTGNIELLLHPGDVVEDRM
jgi:hypothetical protein